MNDRSPGGAKKDMMVGDSSPARGAAKEGQRRQEPAPKRELRGQELGNAMVLHANIAERVRANYGGTLATKKARAELQAALDKEGALNREEISRMLKADRAERN
jgi:hypothetical protein